MNKLISFLILILVFSYSITLNGQINAIKGDSVVLEISDFRGSVQWQISCDGTNWDNISDAIHSFYKFIAEEDAYYRVIITEGTCLPIISDTVFVIAKPIQSFVCGDILKDSRDNREYKTVQIGSQCWTAENLNIGTRIESTVAQSNNNIIEKYCPYNDDNNCEIYGGLYQWDEMMLYTKAESIQGICPDDWHIPSDNEWKELEIALGMTPELADIENTWRGTDQGTKLLKGGSSGYEALLAGGVTSYGGFLAYRQYEYMWSTTEYGTYYAWRRCVRMGDPQVGRWNTFPKDYAFSVRCIKNQ